MDDSVADPQLVTGESSPGPGRVGQDHGLSIAGRGQGRAAEGRKRRLAIPPVDRRADVAGEHGSGNDVRGQKRVEIALAGRRKQRVEAASGKRIERGVARFEDGVGANAFERSLKARSANRLGEATVTERDCGRLVGGGIRTIGLSGSSV